MLIFLGLFISLTGFAFHSIPCVYIGFVLMVIQVVVYFMRALNPRDHSQ